MIANLKYTEAQIVAFMLSTGWRGFNLKYKDPTSGFTLLMISALRNRVLIFDIIHEADPDLIYEVDNAGNTILMTHAEQKRVEWHFLNAYKTANIDFNRKNCRGFTLLESLILRLYDTTFANYGVTDYLVFRTALEKVKFKAHEVARLYVFAANVGIYGRTLIDEIHKASKMTPSVRYSTGSTALHAAIECGVSPKLIRHLISKGANVKAKNGQGKTPLEVISPKSPNAKAYIYYLHRAGANTEKAIQLTNDEDLKQYLSRQKFKQLTSTYTSSSFV